MAALALLLAGVAFWYWLLPVFQDCSSASQQLNQLRAQNQANRALQGQSAMLQRRVSEAEDRLQAVKSMVPDAPDPDAVVTVLRQAEISGGVHVRLLAAQPAVAAQEYVELPYKVHVDGTYFALQNFFNSLAHAARVVNVSGLSLVVPSSSGRGTYKVSPAATVASDFTLSAYCNQAPGAAPAAKKP